MPVPSAVPDPLRIARALSPVLFALGDPDLVVEVLNANPAGVVLVEANEDLTVVYCNDAFQRWAPVSRRPLVGRPLVDAFSWSDRAAMRTAYREVILTGLPLHWRAVPYRSEGASKNGVAYWNASHFPLHGPAGRVTHVLSFTVDVTDQASIRARMNDAQQRVIATLAGVSHHLVGDGEADTFLTDLSGTIAGLVAAEGVTFRLYDPGSATLSSPTGETVPCHPDGGGVVDRVVFEDAVVRDRDRVAIPWRAGPRRLGMVEAHGSTRASGFTDEDVWILQTAAAAGALVWEHRQADEALADLREREMANLRQQMERSIQLEQLKTDFLKLASHELRAPLGVVRGYVSMMEDGTLGQVGEQVAPLLPVLRAKLDDMNRLINDMLETARLEDSALQLRLVRADLRDVVREAVRSVEPLASERHRMITSTPGRPVPVMGDVSRLGMIVTNLVHNAIKYSPRGDEVRVTCTVEDGSAQVMVSDQGIGIAAGDLDSLFTRFGRILTVETVGIAGTGLGLYLARDLARRHGGDVSVESEEGEGSTFTLTLPLAPEQ